ncbi:MAG: aminotransferase class V-fold PLP-dependent enzyme [Ignavibacteriales bacterium]|nr:aminotransferase class V-fold PLP-dependent enzyme [Ignavibacteriales bacterium]
MHLEENPQGKTEESLDPQDWESMKNLGHRMVEDMVEYLRTVRERPVWIEPPPEVQRQFQAPLPTSPQPPQNVYDDFRTLVLPYPTGNIHPRFWGWVKGTGTPLGMLAEMLAAGVNPNAWGANHIATHVETQVLAWCKEMLGYPLDASGLLVSGCSMANLVCLAVARNAKAGYDIANDGVRPEAARLAFYGSVEMHNSIQKAVELMGLGRSALRKIAVDADYRIDLHALRTRIAQDRAEGFLPACVIGNAGTVNTGAIDDIASLAELCKKEELWFHVDGAFGAFAALAPESKHLVRGMELADSLATDMHKWMYMPYEVGVAFVRNAEAHHASFSVPGAYLTRAERGFSHSPMPFNEYGVQLSRGFRALKVWMSLKEHGVEKYGRMIQQNIDQAAYLASLIDATPELELLAPAPLNIVCFRYVRAGIPEETLNAVNQTILLHLQETGFAVPSSTILNGRFALRVANVNHRTRREDFALLVEEVVRTGNGLLALSS